jgi:hypothetical protein
VCPYGEVIVGEVERECVLVRKKVGNEEMMEHIDIERGPRYVDVARNPTGMWRPHTG